MNRLLPAAAAFVVIGVGILAQGYHAERWSARTDEKLQDFVPRIQEVPLVIGDWEGVEQKIDSLQFEGSNAADAISRSYKNSVTGDTVSVYLAVGMAYHMTLHSPDQCYPLNGYSIVAEKSRTEVDCGFDNEVEFARSSFSRQREGVIQVLWTFSDDSIWYGPMVPKTAFARSGALYKLYIITEIQPGENPSATTRVGSEFAKEFLPVLNPILFPPEAESSETENAGDSATEDSEASRR